MNDLDRLMQKLDRMQNHITKIDKKVNRTITRVCVLEEPAPDDGVRERLKELISEVRDVNLLNVGGVTGCRVKPEWLDQIEKEFSL